MHILSINLGAKRTITRKNTSFTTGIFKEPVNGPVEVTRLGLAGDVIADKKHHGGPDQAIYLYSQADYDWWVGELGRPLSPGTFGENLTFSEMESTAFNIGDTLQAGGIVLQVTAPRIPCATLSTRMDDPKFVKKFKAAERPGMYCRVLEPGEIQAGEVLTVTPYQGETVSVLEMYHDHYNPDKNRAALHRYLNAPIAERSRAKKEALLAALD